MKGLGFILAALIFFPSLLFAESSRKELAGRIEKAESTLRYFMDAGDSAIPCQLLHEADAIIFLRQYKVGFILGAKGGNGIVLAKNRNTGEWSPPAFIATAEGSFGFQIGGKMVDAVLLVMNKEGLEFLLKSRFQIGGEMSAAAGPVGREAGVKLGVPAAGILIYSRARGLFAGASFEGGLISSDDRANKTFYSLEDVSIRDILTRNKVPMPQEAVGLVDALQKYESMWEPAEKAVE